MSSLKDTAYYLSCHINFKVFFIKESIKKKGMSKKISNIYTQKVSTSHVSKPDLPRQILGLLI